MMRFSRSPLLAVAGSCVLLAGCTVGPNYKGPPVGIAPVAEQAPGFHRGGDAPVSIEAPAPRWWSVLGDAELNKLIEAALADSPDLQAAEARLRAARASLRATRASHRPSASANAIYLRSNGGSLTGSIAGGQNTETGGTADTSSNNSTFELYNVGFDATWELDLFGGQRRATEAARASAESSAASLADVQVSLSAEVAQAYVQLRDRQQRLGLLRRSAEMQQQILDLTRQRRAQGTASDLDVERQRTQLESTRSTVVPLAGDVSEALDRLALLTGREPGALDAELSTPQPLPVLPAVVPVGDPGALLRRRPDIRAAA